MTRHAADSMVACGSRLALLWVLVAVGRPGTASAAAGDYATVAVMPLTSLGSTDDAAASIERVLHGELAKLLGARMIAPQDLVRRAGLAEDAFTPCDGVVPCLIEVVGGVGWDAFVVGNIAGLGDGRVITLKLIDVRRGGEVRRATEPAVGAESELIAQIRKAAVSVLAPELLTGIIDIQCPQPDVRILVDGELVGTTPMANPRITVPAGRRAIEATGTGLVTFSTLLDVAYDETKTLTISLPRNTVFVGGETPFRNRWWTWTAAVVGVTAVGVGGYFNYLQADTANRIERHVERRTLTIDRKDLYDEEAAHWKRAVTFYAVGGLTLASVGALFVIDFL